MVKKKNVKRLNDFKGKMSDAAATTKEKFIKPIDPENPEARWVEKDQIAELLTHPKDKEFFLSIKDKI